MSAGEVVARGTMVSGAPVNGIFRSLLTIHDVLAAIHDEQLSELVVCIEQASVTNVAPIISRVRGVVSAAGGPTSHLAIVSRGFGTTCNVGASFDVDVASLEGTAVDIGDDGTVRRAPTPGRAVREEGS